MLVFYDYEVFKYDWLAVFKDIYDNKTVIINDRAALEKFHNEHKEHIFIGFNSRNYDQYIHKGILLGFDPYKINDFIINQNRKGWEFSRDFNKIKMYNYDVYKGITDSSLKTLEAYMGDNIEETSVPFNINRKLTPNEISETIKYCTYDVDKLMKVFDLRIDDFNTQLAMINEFGLGLEHMSKTTAQLVSVILGSVKTTYDDEMDVYLPECLNLGKYKAVGDWFLKGMPGDSLTMDVAGVPHIFADGGVHGAINNYCYECKDDELMIMADVTSLYPSLMILFDLLSRTVKDKSKFKHIYNMNIELKKLKDPRRPIYKLICNIVYGASGDKYNSLYDPRNRRLVCIFGQVLLLDLIDKLEGHCELIQSNTDGILIKIKRKDFELIDDIIYEWEQRTGLNMEFDYFRKIVQGDVNNYIAVGLDGKYKSKGGYVKKLSTLDNDLPIINEAIVKYIVENVPVEETIYNCNELIKFQKVYKLTSNYDFVQHNGNKLFNKSYRVFASKNDRDTYLGKVKEAVGTVEKFADCPEHCFIQNGNINDVPVPRNLDKKWYIDLAKKRLSNKFGLM